MIYDPIDLLCPSTGLTHASNKKADDSTRSMKKLVLENNPFGPVVGKIKHIYSCEYRKQRGDIYVASKAICFRRTTLFGWELDRVIIPWESVSSIFESDHGVVTIKTHANELHKIESLAINYCIVKDAISDVWKRGGEIDEVSDDAVRQLMDRVSLMSDSNDGDTAATDEDDSNLSTALSDDVEEEFSSADLARIWSEIYNDKDTKYTENVAVKMRLNITLHAFYEKFLRDDAVVSLVKHHEASGDLDSKATKWERSSKLSQKRLITYNHPIKIPLSIAPPTGAATKTQVMRRFPNGICVDTETWISDVPLADCFYVADRLLVASNPDGGVLLTIKFGNCFVKRTMFKNIIASTSVRDVTEFHKGYCVELARGAIGNSSPAVNTNPIPREISDHISRMNKEGDTNNAVSRKFDLNLCFILLLVVISFGNHHQLSRELHEVNKKLTHLENMLEPTFSTMDNP